MQTVRSRISQLYSFLWSNLSNSVNDGKAQVAMHKNTRTHLEDTSCRMMRNHPARWRWTRFLAFKLVVAVATPTLLCFEIQIENVN